MKIRGKDCDIVKHNNSKFFVDGAVDSSTHLHRIRIEAVEAGEIIDDDEIN